MSGSSDGGDSSNSEYERRLLVCLNPKSGRAEAGLGEALDIFVQAGLALDLRPTRDPAHLDEILASECARYDGVIIAGGDGTVSQASGAVSRAGVPLGVLPTGTANDFARTIGLPLDLRGAAEALATGITRRVDIGRVNGRPFVNVVSLGVSAAMAMQLDAQQKATFGALSYAVGTLSALSEMVPFRARISVDGHVFEDTCLQIAVGSGIFFGGGTRISPDAFADDGLLHGYAIGEGTITDLARILLHIRSGDLDDVEAVTPFSGREIVIETDRPEPLDIDGEVEMETPARVTVEPRGLTVFVAPEYAPDARADDEELLGVQSAT